MDKNTYTKHLTRIATIVSVFIAITCAGVSYWKYNMKEIIFIPTTQNIDNDKKFYYPFLAYMPADSGDSARLYDFVVKYISWTVNEVYEDYEKQTTGDERKIDYLKSKWIMAINASKGLEKESNQRGYDNSPRRYYELVQDGNQWVFNIDAIENVVRGEIAGIYYVTVIGDYTLKRNKRMKKAGDEKVLGYQRIHLVIQEDTPLYAKGQLINPWNLYVLGKWIDPISYSVRDDLFKRKIRESSNINLTPSNKDVRKMEEFLKGDN